MPVVAGPRGLHVFAEAQDYSALLGVDPIQAAADPYRSDQDQNAAQAFVEARGTLTAAETAAAAAASEQRGQATLKISQHVVQIVLRLLGSVPGIAFFPARFVPSHEMCLIIVARVRGHGSTRHSIRRPAPHLEDPGDGSRQATRCASARSGSKRFTPLAPDSLATSVKSSS